MKGNDLIRFIFRLIMALVICLGVLQSTVHADEVVLASGERFASDKIWEENDKIRFNMHGLVVSVNKSDVASIVRQNGAAQVDVGPTPTRHQSIQPNPAPQNKNINKALPNKATRPGPVQKPKSRSKAKPILKGIGFDGISWQMRPSELPGLTKIKTEPLYGGIDQYWQPDGPMSLGNVLVDGLVFGFWQNRLYSIMIWVDGQPGYEHLKRVVFERYGRVNVSKNSPDRYVWVKDRTTDRMLEFDDKLNIGIFWMRSRELDNHIKELYPTEPAG